MYNETLHVASQQLVPREGHVPVIFAFTRKALSRPLRRQAKTSCVAVLSHDGASDLFHAVLREAKAARQQWLELTAAFPSDRDRSRRLVLRHQPLAGGRSQHTTVDELLLNALERRIEEEG